MAQKGMTEKVGTTTTDPEKKEFRSSGIEGKKNAAQGDSNDKKR